MDTDLMFSSKSAEWATPKPFFDKLNEVFKFELDPASTNANCLCPNHYTLTTNGLVSDWDKITFVNPPYGRGVTGKWVEKAYQEFQKHKQTIVMLLPARTDTKWFQSRCEDCYALCFVKGRLVFKNIFIEMEWEEKIASGEKTQAQYDQGYPEAAPFPSVLMIFSTGFSYEGMNVLRDMGWVVETPRKSELIINGGGGQPIGHKDNEVVAGHYVVWKDI